MGTPEQGGCITLRFWIQSVMGGGSSYSLGIDGSAVNRQIIRYNKYVETHTYPKLLIQNVDCFSLELTSGVEREQFFPYFVFDRSLVKTMDIYEHFSWAEKYIPFYRYLGYYDVILEAFFHTNEKRVFEFLSKGYCPDKPGWDGSAFLALDSYTCSYSKEVVNSFREYIAEQKAHGVEIVFVYAPIYQEFWSKVVGWESVYHHFDEIAKEFQVRCLDYSDIEISQDTSFFSNAIHLNSIGADEFSKRLASDLDSLYSYVLRRKKYDIQ